MTWTIDKTIEFGKLQRRLRNAGRTIAVFDPRATDLECEVVRGAIETIDKLQSKEVELSDVSGKLQQREARLREVESKLATTEETVEYLELNPPKGKTNV